MENARSFTRPILFFGTMALTVPVKLLINMENIVYMDVMRNFI